MGKSDLAIRAAGAGFRLVADDRVLVWRSGERVFGRAPRALSGLVEVRGLGVLPTRTLAFACVDLVADLGDDVDRVPEPASEEVLGRSVPRVRLSPRGGTAPERLTRALAMTAGRATGRPF